MNEFQIALSWLSENVASVGAKAVWSAAYSGAVLAAIVLAVNVLFRRWLTASQMLLLWGLVLVRMALPIAPSSQASIHNSLTWLAIRPTATETVTDIVGPLQRDSSPATTVTFEAPVAWAPDSQEAAIANDAEMNWAIDNWVPLIWLAGVVSVLAWTLGTHWRFARRISRVDVCCDQRLLGLWQRCREEVGLRQSIPIVVCDEVSQPAVMGVWQAKLLLPSHCIDLTDEQLRLVMLHELMHVRCWDMSINWLLVLVRAAHWWNPVYWFSQSRYVNLREQSRDAMVLRHLRRDGENSRAYADLLLSMAGNGSSQGWRVMLPASLLGFLSSWIRKRGVADRLRAMATATRVQRRGHRAVVIVAILAIGLIGLTDAKESTPSTEPVYSDMWKRIAEGTGEPFAIQLDAILPVGLTMTESTGPWSEQEYDVTQGATIIMRQKGCDAEGLPALLKWDLVFLADPARVTGPINDESITAYTAGTRSQEDASDKGLDIDNEVSDRPHAELRHDGEQWVIRAAGPESMHQRISQAIHAWNRSGLGQVAIETRIATSQRNVLEAISLDAVRFKAGTVGSHAAFEGEKELAKALRVENDATAVAVSAIEHHIPVLVTVLTDEQTGRFVEAVQESASSNVLSAPKVTMLNGQRAQIFSGVHRPFVVGLKERSDGEFEPQVRIAAEGFDLSLHTELVEGQDGVDLAAALELSDIQDVQEFSSKVAGKDLTVQVPSIRHTRVQTTSRLRDNQTLLLCVPPTYDQKHYAWVLLTARIIAE